MEQLLNPAIRSFARSPLLPSGYMLILNLKEHIVTFLNLHEEATPILGQWCMSHQCIAFLQALLDASPHYCTHQQIHALLYPTALPLEHLHPKERTNRKKQRWELIEQLKEALAPRGLNIQLITKNGYYITYFPTADQCEPIRYYAQEGLFGAGRVLAVHPVLGVATLLETGSSTHPLLAQYRFSPSAVHTLLALLDAWPHCCLYRQVFDRLYPASRGLALDTLLVRRPVFRAMAHLGRGLPCLGLQVYPAREQGYHLRPLSKTAEANFPTDRHAYLTSHMHWPEQEPSPFNGPLPEKVFA